MIAKISASIAAASLLSAPAFAGVYVNAESNSGYTGNDFQASTLETHVGYEGELGETSSWYIQGGPAFVSVDGEDTVTEISGKTGIGVDITERLNVYGEVSFLTEDRSFEEDLGIGVKVGTTYRF